MKDALEKMSKLQMVSIITLIIGGLGTATERLGDIWGFPAVASQISATCTVVVVLASLVLGGATVGKVAATKTQPEEGEGK